MYNTYSFSSPNRCKSRVKPRSPEIPLGTTRYGSTSRMGPIDLFHIFLYPTSCWFTSYNAYWIQINPQIYTIYWWDDMVWADNKKWVSHSLLSHHSKLSACNFVMYHPRLACNWRFQQISVCFWGCPCTMPRVFVHATDAKVISRHAVPKYRLGQYGVGRLLEWAL